MKSFQDLCMQLLFQLEFMEQHHQQLGQDQQAMIETYQQQIRELYESQDKEQAIQEEIWKVQM